MKVIGKLSEDSYRLPKPTILLCCNGISHLEMARHLCVCPEYDYIIFYNTEDLNEIGSACKATNIKFSNDIDLIFSSLHTFDLIFSFNTLTSPYHTYSAPFLPVAKQVGIPIVEIQHGLFQFGINYYDDSKILSFADPRYGQGKIRSFADHQICWFGEDGIGYPRSPKTPAYKPENLKFILLATNLNWYLYSDQDRLHWINLIRNICEKFRDFTFIWKPHPAEINVIKAYHDCMKAIEHSNLWLYGIKNDIFFHGVESHEDLINLCQAGITTPGTSILDFAICNKPFTVFNTEATSELNSRFQNMLTYSTEEELSNFCSGLRSNSIQPYKLDLDLSFKPTKVAEITRQLMQSKKQLSGREIGEVMQSYLNYFNNTALQRK